MDSNYLLQIIAGGENEGVEFKSWPSNNDRLGDVTKYVSAFANTKGGILIIGVEDGTGKITGTNCWKGEPAQSLIQNTNNCTGITIGINELLINKGRVVIITIPRRNKGEVVRSKNKIPYIRIGASIAKMDSQTQKIMMLEDAPDYTAEVAEGLTMDDLDKEALKLFKSLLKNNNKQGHSKDSIEKLLVKHRLILEEGKQVTNACAILLAKRTVLQKRFPFVAMRLIKNDSEMLYIDSTETSQCLPYVLLQEKIWAAIDLDNKLIEYQSGLFINKVKSINEKACREAINNACCHRDYRQHSFVCIDISDNAFAVESPGGFINGISPSNILDKGPAYRNNLLAEKLQDLGLGERRGIGIGSIYDSTISEGKGMPSFEGTNEDKARINIPRIVIDTGFLKFIIALTEQKHQLLSTSMLIQLEKIRRAGSVSRKDISATIFNDLMNLDIIEKKGTTKDANYILSRNYYESQQKLDEYIQVKSLNRQGTKELIIKYLIENKNRKTQRSDIHKAFPKLNYYIVSNILTELKREERIELIGTSKKSGYWKLK